MTSARELRRRVGPLAWAALQDLAEEAELVDGRMIARTSSRRLAGNLGIGKDTAARALRALTAAGLIVVVRSPRERGRFAAGAYALTDAAVSPRREPTVLRSPAARSRSTGAVEVVEQPSLFDAS